MLRRYFFLNRNASELIEYFLISAVSAMLVIRAYLELTGYPQIGGNGLHIAHMLWGGFFMLVALFLTFSFTGGEIKKVAAVLGGIGFGTFVDELGKFITSNNDYFFKPTIAIVYIIFIGIFLLSRAIRYKKKYSQKAAAMNALEYLRELVLHDFDAEERKEALYYLKLSDQSDPFIKEITSVVQKAQCIPHTSTFTGRLFSPAKKIAQRIFTSILLQRIVIVLFMLSSFLSTVVVCLIVFFAASKLNAENVWYIVSIAASDLLFLVGLVFLVRRKKIRAYQFFIHSILISIFFSQFFLFLYNQLAGITSLAVNIFIYILLKNTVSRHEKALS